MDVETIRVEPLAPARSPDYLAFFDHERGPAFADNPRWARCYCHYHEVSPAIDWASLDAAANRVAMRARIEAGEMEGYLAYRGDEVIGWLNAQPRHRLPHCFERMGVSPSASDVPPQDAAVIVCMIVAPTHRRRGVARSLLEGALAHLALRGVRLVDAFPLASPRSGTAAEEYHGPLALYRHAGFEEIGRDGDRVVVRKLLAPPSVAA